MSAVAVPPLPLGEGRGEGSLLAAAPPSPLTPLPAGEGDPFALLADVPVSGPGGLRLFHAVPSALGALRANKGRSLLTTLGIIIGVAAVIAIVALGEGASASVSSQLAGSRRRYASSSRLHSRRNRAA